MNIAVADHCAWTGRLHGDSGKAIVCASVWGLKRLLVPPPVFFSALPSSSYPSLLKRNQINVRAPSDMLISTAKENGKSLDLLTGSLWGRDRWRKFHFPLTLGGYVVARGKIEPPCRHRNRIVFIRLTKIHIFSNLMDAVDWISFGLLLLLCSSPCLVYVSLSFTRPFVLVTIEQTKASRASASAASSAAMMVRVYPQTNTAIAYLSVLTRATNKTANIVSHLTSLFLKAFNQVPC
jgi:hypothetical protein